MPGGAFLPASLAELDSLGLSGPEIRYHGKTMLALVEQTSGMSDGDYPPPVINLIDYPGYKKAFKDIKALVQSVSERSGLSLSCWHPAVRLTGCLTSTGN